MSKLSQNQLLALFFVVCLITFQGVYSIGKHSSYRHDLLHAVANITTQVTGDIDKLPIPNFKLQSIGNQWEVDNYVRNLNNQLQDKNYPVFVHALTTEAPQQNNQGMIIRELQSYKQSLWLIMENKPLPLYILLSVYPLLASLFMTYLFKQYLLVYKQPEQIEEIEEEAITAWLQIDLKQKVLVNLHKGTKTELANKPLCFFCALIDLCQQNPDLQLNPNKDLPEEMVNLSNKYFFRLIDLGHTIRKRPNFTNNLEKTLSEIRAALDEIFDKDFERKDVFYPPKAIGEGSRSKAHNVALKHLDLERLEFVGK